MILQSLELGLYCATFKRKHLLRFLEIPVDLVDGVTYVMEPSATAF